MLAKRRRFVRVVTWIVMVTSLIGYFYTKHLFFNTFQKEYVGRSFLLYMFQSIGLATIIIVINFKFERLGFHGVDKTTGVKIHFLPNITWIIFYLVFGFVMAASIAIPFKIAMDLGVSITYTGYAMMIEFFRSSGFVAGTIIVIKPMADYLSGT